MDGVLKMGKTAWEGVQQGAQTGNRDNLNFALAYASLGWAVLPLHSIQPDGRCSCNKQPCTHSGKHPRTKRGLQDATTDKATVRRWWTEWPHANIGLALKSAGLCAIDIDPRNGGSMDAVEVRGEVPSTLVQKTGGGGQHLLFRLPANIKLPGILVPGVDIKHDGYIVLEPSNHVRGGSYQFDDWSPIEGEVPDIAVAPEWLTCLGRAEGIRSENFGATKGQSQSGKVCEGGRNEALSREAFRYRKKGYEVRQIEEMLFTFNRSVCEPPLSADEVRAIARGKERINSANEGRLTDFWAYLPAHQYLHVPTHALWPAASVDGWITDWPLLPGAERPIKPSKWLDINRPIVQTTWCPDEPQVIEGRVVADGGWIHQPNVRVYNLYRAPFISVGNSLQATTWLDHLQLMYPSDWKHIVSWLAHRIQRPGEKINHALVLGGAQGIGKDTILEPIKRAVGSWNWSDINPTQMLGRFNGWAKAVVVRISEARDLGDVDRFAFYDHSKIYIAAPPDVIRVDEKNLREHSVFNVMGVIITSNHRTDGLFLPPDDRRHFVAWSELTRDQLDSAYWTRFYRWYETGGNGHVAAYLRTYDLSGFDAKAPPPKTPAFHSIVAANQDPDDSELADLIEFLGSPRALTLDMLVKVASSKGLDNIREQLTEHKYRRGLPHKLDRAGYISTQNPDTSDKMWRVSGARKAIYCQKSLTLLEQVQAARALQR